MTEVAQASTDGLADLRDRVDGTVYGPRDDGYTAAVATWDRSARYAPRAVVVAAGADDISAAARWAAEAGLGIGVLATGHGAIGTLDDAVLVNTSALKAVRLDAERPSVTVQPGASWTDVQNLTTPHGLVGLLGGSAGVGVTGYTLGGGLSPLGRTFGFAADRVTRLTVLDHEYRPISVDADREPELFWALRGGGGLGIVTELEFDVVSVPTLFGGGVYFSGDDAATVLSSYRDWLPTLDERTSTSLALLHLPPIPALPDMLRGKYVTHLRIAHVDNADHDLESTGRALLAPMLAAATVINDYTRVMTPEQLPDIHRDPVAPTAAAYRGGYLKSLDDAAISGLVDAARGTPGAVPRLVEIRHLGGAMTPQPTPPNSATARASAFNLYVTATADPADPDPARSLVDGIVDEISAPGIGRQLSFYGPAPEPGEILRLWSDPDAQRLLAAHDRLDPDDRIRSGHRLR
jgi:FAD/FMN-containing dehydrogenase